MIGDGGTLENWLWGFKSSGSAVNSSAKKFQSCTQIGHGSNQGLPLRIQSERDVLELRYLRHFKNKLLSDKKSNYCKFSLPQEQIGDCFLEKHLTEKVLVSVHHGKTHDFPIVNIAVCIHPGQEKKARAYPCLLSYQLLEWTIWPLQSSCNFDKHLQFACRHWLLPRILNLGHPCLWPLLLRVSPQRFA